MGSTSLLWRVDDQSRGDVLHSGKVDRIHISFWRVDVQPRADVLHSGKVDVIYISSLKSRCSVKRRCPPQSQSRWDLHLFFEEYMLSQEEMSYTVAK
jgi:hypothetical protein